MTIEKRRETIRDIINSSGNHFCRVTYVKRDGTMRAATVHPASAPHRVKGGEASESAQAAVKTRAANHPELFNYFEPGKGWRSLNLDRVTRIAVNGLVMNFPDLREG